MAFNPDQYLAKKAAAGGFDPDAYLASKTKSTPQYGQAQTALEHGANAISLGYLPQLQAAAQDPIFRLLNTVTGQNIEPDPYVDARDANVTRLALEQEQNPKTALGAQIGVTQAASKGINALANSDISLKKFAAEKAVKGSGAMLKDFRQLTGKGAVDDIGQFALDKKLVQAGDSVETIAQKAKALNQEAGSRLETLYDSAKKAIPSALEGSSAELEKLSDKEFRRLARVGFNPERDKKLILRIIKKDLKNEVDGKGALNRVSEYLDDLVDRYGHKTLNPKAANDIKSAIDRKINYSRNPMAKEPDVESAFKMARKFLSKKIDEHIDFLGKYMGDEAALKALKEANRDYGYSKQVMNMATDKMNRENTNRMFGLTDTIAGSAGGAAGAVAGSVLGGDQRDAIEGSAIGALVGGVGNKLARTYGNPILASGANKLGSAAKYTTAPVGRGMNAGFNPDAVSRGLLEAGLLSKDKKKNDKRSK
jgi:hypothetical protein